MSRSFRTSARSTLVCVGQNFSPFSRMLCCGFDKAFFERFKTPFFDLNTLDCVFSEFLSVSFSRLSRFSRLFTRFTVCKEDTLTTVSSFLFLLRHWFSISCMVGISTFSTLSLLSVILSVNQFNCPGCALGGAAGSFPAFACYC